jgi:hypothetical protein
MKTIAYILMLAGIVLAAGSCEQEELKRYDGKEGVYFYMPSVVVGYVQYEYVDSIARVEFGRVQQDTLEKSLRVMITGRTKPYPRQFKVAVVAGKTTAVEGANYEPLPDYYTVEAGANFADVPVRLFRNDNIAAEERRLDLQLVPTEDFEIGISLWEPYINSPATVDLTRFSLLMTGFLAQPTVWQGSVATTGLEGGYWGAYSSKKLLLMCELFHLTYDDFMDTSIIGTNKRYMMGEALGIYLQRLYDARTPVLEDDGRLMWATGVSWSSVVGVAWDGAYH